MAPIDYGKADMTGYSYSTGALFFGLLQTQFGEEALLAFLRDYFQKHRDSGSTDRGFAEALVAAFGEESRDLVDDWFLTPAFAEKIQQFESWEDLENSYR